MNVVYHDGGIRVLGLQLLMSLEAGGTLTHKDLANVVESCHDNLVVSRLRQLTFRSQIFVIARISYQNLER